MAVISRIKEIILENKRSMILFLIVGSCTALFYISFFTFLWKVFQLNYHIAITIAYTASIVLYFLANRHVTFKNNSNGMGQQVPRYAALLLLNYLVTLSITHIAVEFFSLSPPIGIICSIATTCMLSYTLARFWIFKTS